MNFSPRSSLVSRMMIWESSVAMIADRPLFGIGIGRFQETYLAYQRYFPPYLEWAVPQPHSFVLAVWLQTGLIGLAGLITLVGVWIRGLAVLLREEDPYTAITSVLLLSVLSFWLILGLADTPFFKTDLAFSFWFLLAFGIGFLENERRKKTAGKTAAEYSDR